MLTFRYALVTDVGLYFKWVNDATVRQNSLNTKEIELKDHVTWFTHKIENPDVFLYLFLNQQKVPVGQVIIQRKKTWVSVGQSVAQEHRGKKYSSEMLSKATNDFLKKFPEDTIVSVVKSTNKASLKMSINSGFHVVAPDDDNDKILVLKGNRQNDTDFIVQFKHFFKLL